MPASKAALSEDKQRNSSVPSTLQPNSSMSSSSTRASAKIPPKLPNSAHSAKKRVKAVYDFSSEDLDDLTFKMGDLIEVLDSSDQYGWWVGKDFKGKTGNFPSNYVTEE